MRQIISKNPFTGFIKQQFDFINNEVLLQKINKSAQGYSIQKKRTINERAQIIAQLKKCIEKRKKQIGQIITFQMGKTLSDAEDQVNKVIRFCKYYSEKFDPILSNQIATEAKKKTLIQYEPLGVIYLIVPFNFPFFLNFKAGLPNLLLGNCLLARNSDSTPLVGQIIEQLMCQAGFASGEYHNIYTSHNQLDLIMSNKNIVGVSFTGSSKAGGTIASIAGKYLKKSVLELGGNDPFVVLIDANINLAVDNAVKGRCKNSGQICFSPKRFIIIKQLYDKFKTMLIERLSQVKFGDPTNANTEMGPLARQDIWNSLDKQLRNLPESYKIIWQREGMNKPFFPITVIEASSEVFDEQLFGPIFTLYCADNQQHALSLANDGSYGLGASVYSRAHGSQFIEKVRCGMGFVNELVRSDTTFPSGGVGKSGYGRQCGIQGYRQFANIKTLYVS